MREMNVADVCEYLYPGEMLKGNIAFGMNPGSKPWITVWNVENVDKPSIEQLEQKIDDLKNDFNLKQFKAEAGQLIDDFIITTANERGYDSGISCISYLNSKNSQWQLDAQSFLTWRDSLFSYIIDQYKKIEDGTRPIPSFDDLIKEIPKIEWTTGA